MNTNIPLSISMFFLAVGEVEVVTEFGEVIDQAKGPNAWFGEVGILEGLPRTATIKPTSATCSVFELKKSDVKELMVKYPEIGDKIVESSQERLQKYLMRSILA